MYGTPTYCDDIISKYGGPHYNNCRFWPQDFDFVILVDILATTRLCSLQRGGTTPGGGSRVAQVPGTFRIALSNAAPTFPLAIRSLASTFTPKSHPKPRPSPRDPTSSPLLSLSRHRRRNRPSLSSPSHSPSLTPQKTHVPFFTYT